MAIPKFKKYYQLMSDQNEKLFAKFDEIHSEYEMNHKSRLTLTKFNKVGLEVTDTARFWERKLCSGMERGKNATYSDKLADKFWGEIRKRYSKIDMVGVKTKHA